MDIFYINADQLLNKINMFISGNEPDVILITEVLPKVHSQFVTKARLSLMGYSIFTNFDFQSPSAYHGIRGVAIYVSHKLSAKEINFNQDSFNDHLWVKIYLKGADSLLIGCVYRSPSSDIVSSTTCLICNLLRSVNGFSHLLICGDFNYSGIDWGTVSPKSSGSPIMQTIIDTIHLYMSQHPLHTKNLRL